MKYLKKFESILTPYNMEFRKREKERIEKEEIEKAKKKFRDSIYSEFVRTDMGSGWRLELYCDFRERTLKTMTYLDDYDGEDDPEEYEMWKEDFLESSIEEFIQNFEDDFLDYFIE